MGNDGIGPRFVQATILLVFFSSGVFAQSSSLRGFVTDQHGAVVPGATVTARGPNIVKTATTDQSGSYSISGLPPGTYSITASAPSLVLQEPAVKTLTAGVQSLNLQLSVVLPDQKMTVEDNAEARVSTEASNNASAQVLRGEDLDAPGDSPEDLAADLLVAGGRKYTLSISMSVRNLLNHTNPGPIIGNITSPLFGQANQPAGSSGFGFSEAANNRRLELQTRLTF